MAEKIKLGSNGNFGVKEGGTLAYNDENGVFKAIELASSRASGATYVAQSGLIADAEVGVPRIDWTNGVGELLLEPQSTNLINYSENFSDASWSKQAGTVVTANQAIAPDGSLTADLIVGNGTNGILKLSLGTTTNTKSVWLRAVSGTETVVLKDPDETIGTTTCNLTTEWQRFSLSETQTSTFGFWIDDIPASGIYAWGAQSEALPYATSYIRTSGSSVTRIADAVTGNSSLGQVINSSEGVLYVEMSALANDSSRRTISISESANNRVVLRYDNASNRIQVFIKASTFTYGNITDNTYDITDTLKIAYKWKSGDFSLWINGVESGSLTDTFSIPANTLNELTFDDGTSNNPFYGRVKELKVYDTALTDAELTTLTTI